MDMSNSPNADTADNGKTKLRPGDPHNRDMSNPGEIWAFVLAAALVGGLGLGFLFGGLAGMGLVMVALVPAVYVVLVMISVGR